MRNMTKRRRALMASSSSQHGRLPTGYREVEWLQSSGTQYCVTDIIPTSTNQSTFTAIRGDVTLLNKTTSKFQIGTNWMQSSNVWKYGCFFSYSQALPSGSYNSRFIYQFGPSSNANSYFDLNNQVFPIDIHYELNKDNVYKMGQSFATYQYMYTPSRPLVIGGDYNNSAEPNAFNNNSRYKIFKIYNVDTLLYEFVPCYRTSDNKTGFMKITVADGSTEFFPNLGEDEWIIGPVV